VARRTQPRHAASRPPHVVDRPHRVDPVIRERKGINPQPHPNHPSTPCGRPTPSRGVRRHARLYPALPEPTPPSRLPHEGKRSPPREKPRKTGAPSVSGPASAPSLRLATCRVDDRRTSASESNRRDRACGVRSSFILKRRSPRPSASSEGSSDARLDAYCPPTISSRLHAVWTTRHPTEMGRVRLFAFESKPTDVRAPPDPHRFPAEARTPGRGVHHDYCTNVTLAAATPFGQSPAPPAGQPPPDS